jgi:hypothetical protein
MKNHFFFFFFFWIRGNLTSPESALCGPRWGSKTPAVPGSYKKCTPWLELETCCADLKPFAITLRPLRTRFSFFTSKDILIVFVVLLILLLLYMFIQIQNFLHLKLMMFMKKLFWKSQIALNTSIEIFVFKAFRSFQFTFEI